MPAIVATIEVNRPAGDVFAYSTNPGLFPEWQKGVIGGRTDEPGPPRVGNRFVTTRRIGFVDRPFTSEIAHVHAPTAWGVLGIDGPIRAVVDVAVEPLSDSSSRLTITIDFRGRGIGRMLVPLVVRPEARKEMPANLASLKRRLEGGA